METPEYCPTFQTPHGADNGDDDGNEAHSDNDGEEMHEDGSGSLGIFT